MKVEAAQHIYEVASQAVSEARYDEATSLFDQLLNQTNRLTTDAIEKDIRLNSLRDYGRLLRLIGQKDASLRIFEQYRDESNNDHHTVNALNGISQQYVSMGLHQEAIDNSKVAIALATQLNYKRGLGQALASIGYVYLILGRHEIALERLQKASTLLSQSGNPLIQFNNYIYMGLAHHYGGELDKAIDSYQQALQMARQREMYPQLAVALNNLGEIYQNIFNTKQALAYHQEALALVETYKIHRVEGDILRNLGVDLSYTGHYDEGITYLQRALDISQKMDDIELEMVTLYAYALAAHRHGNAELAREYGLQLYEHANEQEATNHQAYALHILGLYEQSQSEPSLAEEMWQQAIFLAHEANERRLLWQIHAAMAQIVSNPKLAQVHNRIASEIIQQMAHPIQDETLRETFLAAPPIQTVLHSVH